MKFQIGSIAVKRLFNAHYIHIINSALSSLLKWRKSTTLSFYLYFALFEETKLQFQPIRESEEVMSLLWSKFQLSFNWSWKKVSKGSKIANTGISNGFGNSWLLLLELKARNFEILKFLALSSSSRSQELRKPFEIPVFAIFDPFDYDSIVMFFK